MSNYSHVALDQDPNTPWHKVFEYIPPYNKVLDVGCSSGNFGHELMTKKQCIVDGIELDRDDYSRAKKQLRNVLHINIETDDLSPLKDTYDYIYFGDVIEHLVQPVQTLKRIKTLLAKSGEVVFSIPNMAHAAVRLMLLQGTFQYGEVGLLDKTHLHFYTYGEIQRVFAEAGYGIIHLDPVVKEYPLKQLEKDFAKLGLKADKKFLDMLQKPDATAWEYVGAAKPSDKPVRKNQAILPISPSDEFYQYANTIGYYKKVIKDYGELEEKYRLALLEQRGVSEKLEQKENELNNIKDSKLYRTIRKVQNRVKQ